MYEYEIVRIARRKEQKTKEVKGKRDKIETQTYTEVGSLMSLTLE